MSFHTTWWYARALFWISKKFLLSWIYLFFVLLIICFSVYPLLKESFSFKYSYFCPSHQPTFKLSILTVLLNCFWRVDNVVSSCWYIFEFWSAWFFLQFTSAWWVDNIPLDTQQLQFPLRQWSITPCFDSRYSSCKVCLLEPQSVLAYIVLDCIVSELNWKWSSNLYWWFHVTTIHYVTLLKSLCKTFSVSSAGITEGFSMCGGDFIEVYNESSHAGKKPWLLALLCFIRFIPNTEFV